jgi:hypothetical protein
MQASFPLSRNGVWHFARVVNHATKDALEDDVLQQVMATTLEEQLSPLCLDHLVDYFNPGEEEVEF